MASYRSASCKETLPNDLYSRFGTHYTLNHPRGTLAGKGLAECLMEDSAGKALQLMLHTIARERENTLEELKSN